MSVTPVAATEVMRQIDRFDTVIDARSEDEFALDHIPGALNWPTLDNAERHEIGTLYKQVNPFEARKRGAAIAARNIATHIERCVLDKARDWAPLVYCWRGGQRSGSLALVLGQIGFRVRVADGGYKAFRAALVLDTARMAGTFSYRVVCGTTGSGKTRLLGALARGGAQVLDLEALASHRSSVLGAIPGQPQPTQKAFDTRIWDVLRRFDSARPVYVESESRKVGNLTVPSAFMDALRRGACLNLVLSEPERVALLMEDYDFFARNPEAFCARLDVLSELRGKALVAQWKQAVSSGHVEEVVRDLLATHYDPGYESSMRRNFTQFAGADVLMPTDRSERAMDVVARAVMKTETVQGQPGSMAVNAG